MGLRVLFFGNSGSTFSNRHFGALRKSACTIAAVVDTPPAKRTSTNPRGGSEAAAPFTQVARRLKVPIFEPARTDSLRFVRAIEKLHPDLFVAVGYTGIFKKSLLEVPKILAANFHASLLPAYRGKHPVFWALRNDERSAGLTVHVMEAGIDTGDILYQVRVRTRRRDSVASLYEKIIDRSLPLVGRLVKDAAKGTLCRRPQSRSGASCYSSVSEEDFRLDWSEDARKLERWICASPGRCFCDIAGVRTFFMDARAERGFTRRAPGTIVRLGRKTCTIAAGKGLLRLQSVRLKRPDSQESIAEMCRRLGVEKDRCIMSKGN